MSKVSDSKTAKSIIDEVLGRGMTREIWTSNYQRVLPVSVQEFDLGAILPAVFYLFRFGHRRGKGHFLDAFGGEEDTVKGQKQAATVARTAAILAGTDGFLGFDGAIPQAVLGDLLLCFCLENKGHALGRNEQIQRVAPAHYMASWIDLPERSVNLRYVPEMIVALLADQRGSEVTITKEGGKLTRFAVGRGFEDNVLLGAFRQGVFREGLESDRNADRFREESEVGLDQLLMIRLAQQLKEPPDKLREKNSAGISNQRPIAKKAAEEFSGDIRLFVRAYADRIPRHAFLELLESCIALGLTTIIGSTFSILLEWKRTGWVNESSALSAPELFVDCSNGISPHLQALSEQSMDDHMRRVESVPAILMALRLLDNKARSSRKIEKANVPFGPYATEWLCLLGEILFQQHAESAYILRNIDEQTQVLAEKLEEDHPEAAAILRGDDALPNPVWRLAEALTLLQGRGITHGHVSQLMDSAAMVNRQHGLMIKRKISRKEPGGVATKRRDVRAVRLTDSVLDYLVHRHGLHHKRLTSQPIPLQDFLRLLRERHGFFVDRSPPGMPISGERLQDNRQNLERRLRDLGLLVGVNDAESMKYLRPRFEPRPEMENAE